MGFKGAKPFCESLSTFFSEESRGPSRPERQMKRNLRGKSQSGKGEKTREKSPAHIAQNRQTGSQNKAKMCARKRTARKQGSGRKNPHKTGRRRGRRAGNKATERGPTSGKSCTQPPGGGSAGQTKNSGQPQAGNKAATHRRKKRRDTEHKSPPQQRLASKKRPPRQTARHAGRRKTPPNRQNSRSLFCLPGGAL